MVYTQQYYKKVLKVLRARPDVVLAYWEPGNLNSADVCAPGGSAAGYGPYAWVIGSQTPLPTGSCG